MSNTLNYSIIIDLDNTIIDTAIRKQQLLKDKFNISASINDIRKDYNLEQYFGNKNSITYNQFVKFLDSSVGIRKYNARAFSNSDTIINKLLNDGFKVFILSARPNFLLNETKEELESLGIKTERINLILNDGINKSDNEGEAFKKEEINKISRTEKILVLIGDRLADLRAAKANNIPSILFNGHEKEVANFTNTAGFFIENEWLDIYTLIKNLIQGSKQIEELRLKMIDQYAAWLGDLDNKIILNVAISVGILGLSGTIMKQKLPFTNLSDIISSIFMIISFLTALASLLYSLRAITSRHTSGPKAEKPIRTKLFHAINILLPRLFGNYKYISEKDPVKFHDELVNKSEIEQKYAHLTYFQETFNTYDQDALLNLRLFALKATNYAKIYPERISTKLLNISIGSVAMWLLTPFLIDFLTLVSIKLVEWLKSVWISLPSIR